MKWINDKNLVHPIADKWFTLYTNILTSPKLIENNEENGMRTVSYGDNPPNIPPINFSGPYIVRLAVFQEHVKHGYDMGNIYEVDKYLRNLEKQDWVHF